MKFFKSKPIIWCLIFVFNLTSLTWDFSFNGQNQDRQRYFNSNIAEAAPLDQYTLTVNKIGSGTVTFDPSGGIYNEGDIVTVVAGPQEGYKFIGFSGDLSGSEPKKDITIDGDKSVTAVFDWLGGTGVISAGPYLQPVFTVDEETGVVLEDLSNFMGVGIRTAGNYICEIEYKEEGEAEWSSSKATTEGTQHYIKLSGLMPGRTYEYRVVVSDSSNAVIDITPVYEFRTSPPDGKFKMIVGSDWHFAVDRIEYPRFDTVMPDMLAFDPDVIFLTGDTIDGSLESYDYFFGSARELLATAIVVLVTGNHDDDRDLPLDNWREIFYLPENGPKDLKEISYSLDYGGVHFAALHMWDVDTEWLNQDLEAAKANNPNFIFVGSHQPTQGSRSKGGAVRPVYDKHGADIEFTGHNHRLHRSFPLIDNSYDTRQWGIKYTPEKEYYGANIEGTIYHGVRSLYYGKMGSDTGPASLHFAVLGKETNIGYTEVTVDGKVCDVKSYGYNASGLNRELEDHYTINKDDTDPLPQPVISDITVSEVSAHRAVINWQSDISSRGQVEFWPEGGLVINGDYPYLNMREEQNQQFKTEHRLALQCLTPDTTYHFRVKSWRAGEEGVIDADINGNPLTFTTASDGQAGERVAEFDFGGIQYKTDVARASPGHFDSRIRQGWTFNAHEDSWNQIVGEENVGNPPELTDTFCMRSNDRYPAAWSTVIPDGTYDVEVTAAKGGSYYWGEEKLVIEDTLTFEAPKSLYPTDQMWIWPGRVTVSDGSLDLELGYGEAGHGRNSIINGIKIWTQGHFTEIPPIDVTPPSDIIDLTPTSTTNNSVTLAWQVPGDDGDIGQAARYEIWYSPYGETKTGDYWRWVKMPSPPLPQSGGTIQSYTIAGLAENKTYTFVVRTYDEVPNLSLWSNIAQAVTEAGSGTYYNLTVNSLSGGSVIISPSGGTYESGSIVTLEAVAQKGYKFSGWLGDLSGTSETAVITIDSDKNITANFVESTPVNTPPVVNAGTNQTVTLPNSVSLRATVTDDGLIEPLAFVWSKQSGPADVIFSDINSVNAEVSFTQPGTYVLKLSAYDGENQASDEAAISVFDITGDTASTLIAEADAHTYQAYPNNYNNDPNMLNYGHSGGLYVRNHETVYDSQGYLRFDLSGIPNASIENATLRVYSPRGFSDSLIVSVCDVDSWTEEAITWNNAPIASGPLAVELVKAGWNEFDVTNFVKSQSDGKATFKLEMLTPQYASAVFISREGRTDWRPQLVITHSSGVLVEPDLGEPEGFASLVRNGVNVLINVPPQEAVNAAQPGDEVILSSGRYYNAINITKSGTPDAPITIKGQGPTRPVIDASGFTSISQRTAVAVSAANVIVDGLEVKDAADMFGFDNPSGISVGSSSNNVTIRNCRVHNNTRGISASGTDTTIENCEISYNHGIGAGNARAFTVNSKGTATIKYNHIHANGGMGYSDHSQYTVFAYNYVHDNGSYEEFLSDDAYGPQDALIIGNIFKKPPYSTKDSFTVLYGYDRHGGTGYFINNTIISNQSGRCAGIKLWDNYGTGLDKIVLFNNIIYNAAYDTAPVVTGAQLSQISGSNNWVQTNAAGHNGLLNTLFGTHPGFVDFTGADYRLASGSACIDSGSDDISPLPEMEYIHPQDAYFRPVDGNIDIGAYEYITGALGISTQSLRNAELGAPYSQTFSAYGGLKPYRWSISKGSLPQGLSINQETGDISGIPQETGIFSFTVTAADNTQPQNICSKELYITVKSELSKFTVSVNVLGQGASSPSGNVVVTEGGNITITANAQIGHHLKDIVVDGVSMGVVSPFVTFKDIDSNHTVNIIFEINTYTLDIKALNGQVIIRPDLPEYDHGTVVELEPITDQGYGFVEWSGHLSGISVPAQIVMEGKRAVTANFSQYREGYVTEVDSAESLQAALNEAYPGDTILIADGTYNLSAAIITTLGGTRDYPITIKAKNSRKAILTRKGRVIEFNKPNYRIEGVVIDGQYSTTNGIFRVQTAAHGLYIKDCVIKNNMRHIVNMTSPNGVIVDSCEIYNAYWFRFEEGKPVRDDAHGISTEGATNLIIINTSIHDVSGDCLQPEYGNWDNILVENCHFYNAPVTYENARAVGESMGLTRVDLDIFTGDKVLNTNSDPSDDDSGLTGKWPGENAIDTKSNAPQVRGRIILRNSVFNGWHSEYITNCAALNLKMNIDAEVENCTLYDNEIAFRLRGRDSAPDGAFVTVKNCVIYDNQYAIRSEDSIRYLHVWNNTFGLGNINPYIRVSGNLHETFQAYNNLFINSVVPADFTDASNLTLDTSSVVDVNSNDYHLAANSLAIDAGINLSEVTDDKDGNPRPYGLGYDIGSYEYVEGPQPDTYTITATAGLGGSISPSGEVLVTQGGSKTFTITADRGYRIEDVFVGGVSKGPISTYTFENVTSDKFIHADFTGEIVDQYTITISPQPQNGTIVITPAGGIYDEGTVVTVAAKPASGYVFEKWSGSLSGSSAAQTITMNSNKTISASFLDTTGNFILSVDIIGKGKVTLNPSSPAGYAYNTKVEATAVPDEGYEFLGWAGDFPSRQYYISPITVCMDRNKEITAVFNWVGTGVITRGPYLQPTEDMETSIGVAFRTSSEKEAAIHYGIGTVEENTAVSPAETNHYIILTGLEPGARYMYKVVCGDEETPVYSFRTSSPNGYYENPGIGEPESVKILVGSDWHFGGDGQKTNFLHVYRDMLKFDPDVIFNTGDIVNIGNHLYEYDDLFNTCRELFATAVLAPTTGNHEWAYDDDLEVYVEQYYLPENGPEGYKERTYSFNYGGVHFVSVDSGYKNCEDWAKDDLAAAKQGGINFIFTGMHYPAYLDTYWDRALSGSEYYKTIDDEYGVDIQFGGHRHMYQRTYPLLSNPYNIPQKVTEWGIITTPASGDPDADPSDLDIGRAYGADVEGTIYVQNRSLWYSKPIGYPDLHYADPGEKTGLGFTEVEITGKVCKAEALYYSKDDRGIGADTYVEDRYVIDKTKNTEEDVPVISDVNVARVGGFTAVIEWQSDISSRSLVEFGTSPGEYKYVDIREDHRQVFETSHKAVLQCLTPETTYYFRVKSRRAGKEGVSEEYSFTTLPVSKGDEAGEFDFGGIMYMPQGVRVSTNYYEESLRQGWIIPGWPWHVGLYTAGGHPADKDDADATKTFRYRQNDAFPATWRAALPNGKYDVEVTSSSGGYFFGDTRIIIEDGQGKLEFQTPEGTIDDRYQAKRVWLGPVEIKDGFLDLLVGYGESGYYRNSVISRVRIWAAGYYDEDNQPDIIPPAHVTDLKITDVALDEATGKYNATLEWTAPGDDGNTGKAKEYDIRYYHYLGGSYYWGGYANHVEDEPEPALAGTAQTLVISGLNKGWDYSFVMKVIDDAGNISPFSNEVALRPDIEPLTLGVMLTADPVSGSAPLEGVSLKADVYGTQDGNITYYFQSNNSSGSFKTISSEATFENVAETSMTAENIGNYQKPYTYYGKVVVKRGPLQAENRVAITVTGDLDMTPPSRVSDLSVPATTDTSITLKWTAPGDDGTVGRAAIYDLRYSLSEIASDSAYDNAFHTQGEPFPNTAGKTETFEVTGLIPNTRYYFAIKVKDEAINLSALSNTVSATTSEPPPQVTYYNLTANTQGTGSVMLNPAGGRYIEGTTVTLTAQPASGWTFQSWSGSLSGTANPQTLTMDSNKTITAAFTQTPVTSHTIVATAGSGGTITPSGEVQVEAGLSKTFSITANTGHHILDVFAGGQSQGPLSTYTFNNVTYDKFIHATFEKDTYNLTIQSTNGSITLNPNQATYDYGTQVILTAISDSGYQFTGWSGSASGTTNPITITMDSDKTITANFSIKTYAITSSSNSGGTITPLGSVSKEHNQNQTYTIAPQTGCHIEDVVVDGVSAGVIESYTFTNISANHSIEAVFGINTYTIKVSSKEGGSISPSGEVVVSHGNNQDFKITPNSGYHIDDVIVDGASKGEISTYTFTNVTENGHTIEAIFIDRTPPEIIITSHSNGSLTNQTSITLQGTIDGTPFSEARQLPNEGNNTITREAVDQAGNRASVSITIVRDTIAPSAPTLEKITPNLNKGYTRSQNINISGTKEAGSSILINQAEVIGIDSSTLWEHRYQLEEGPNTLTITSRDRAFNVSSPITQDVTLKTKVKIIPVGPIKNILNSQDLIQGTQDIILTYTVDDGAALLTQRATLSEGQNAVTIEAEDFLGNRESLSQDYILDTTPPIISITSNQTVEVSPALVEGKVEDSLSQVKEFKINGQLISLKANSFSESVALRDGLNTIILEAEDNAGNEATETAFITYNALEIVESDFSSASSSSSSDRIIAHIYRPRNYKSNLDGTSKDSLNNRKLESQESRLLNSSSEGSGDKTSGIDDVYPEAKDNYRDYPRDSYLKTSEKPALKESTNKKQPERKKITLRKDVNIAGNKIPPEPVKSLTMTEKEETGKTQIIIKAFLTKKIFLWRRYKLESGEGYPKAVRFELVKSHKLPKTLNLNKEKGTIYGFVWGKPMTLNLELIVTLEDGSKVDATCEIELK
ncbi:MAG: fibronectin type III domain-containing protein [Candidatus Omnitrophota bacterium]